MCYYLPANGYCFISEAPYRAIVYRRMLPNKALLFLERGPIAVAGDSPETRARCRSR